MSWRPPINELILRRAIRSLAQIAPGIVAIGLITLTCFGSKRPLVASFLYLVVVVLQSLWTGFGKAALVSLFATACLDYFFIPPLLEWQIDDPQDAVALLTYLATSLVITRLASRARAEARTAERKRRDTERLYEAASHLLLLDPEVAAGPQSLRVFRDVFNLRAACFLDTSASDLQLDGESLNDLEEKTREAGRTGRDYCDRGHQVYIRCFRTSGTITGAVGFEGAIGDDSVALALSALAATAHERGRAFRLANKAAADAQAEILRSAILDAFAHELKTPLAIILAAAGGLGETGGLLREQREMTEIIEEQAMRLSQLTSRLLRLARVDRGDVSPRMESLCLHTLLRRTIEQCRKQFGRGIYLSQTCQGDQVMADPELLGLAVTQLLDNACKYSFAESAVAVELASSGQYMETSVTNEDSSVSPAERELIFERFFRGSVTEHSTPGAGLGLYVARKIVAAHGGTVELDRSRSNERRTTFLIRLPISKQVIG